MSWRTALADSRVLRTVVEGTLMKTVFAALLVSSGVCLAVSTQGGTPASTAGPRVAYSNEHFKIQIPSEWTQVVKPGEEGAVVFRTPDKTTQLSIQVVSYDAALSRSDQLSVLKEHALKRRSEALASSPGLELEKWPPGTAKIRWKALGGLSTRYMARDKAMGKHADTLIKAEAGKLVTLTIEKEGASEKAVKELASEIFSSLHINGSSNQALQGTSVNRRP
jgi:hypothetical protein